MNEIWVLSVRTSLPKVSVTFADMNLEMQCFESFEKARAEFREKVKSFAFTKNAMFDGNGRITHLAEYLDREDCDDEDDDGVLTAKRLNKIQAALACAFRAASSFLDFRQITKV